VQNGLALVPVALLLNPDLLATTKVIWMALRLHPQAGRAELERLTGLTRHTVQRGMGAALAVGRPPGGPRVEVPGALLAEREVGAPAKVLYGLLQAFPQSRGQAGAFTFAALAKWTGLGGNCLRRAVAELLSAGWVQTAQASRVKPIRYTLGSPAFRRSQAEADQARRRLKRAKYAGEAIMQEYLSLLIDSDQFTDNARPGFLVSPLTGERLELDRFYPQGVAFEYNGLQHYRATGRFSQAEADAQNLRDLIKAGLCLYRGIQLVIVHAADLSLQGMLARIGRSMPLRDLAGHEPLIDLLEEASIAYRAAAAAGR